MWILNINDVYFVDFMFVIDFVFSVNCVDINRLFRERVYVDILLDLGENNIFLKEVRVSSCYTMIFILLWIFIEGLLFRISKVIFG